ncbi:MAG TPA: serine hydrolase, partial [Steroidobacteraceae bacterium]|nr:serine hydrolase [Steroidobacteraceae bacterium]
MLRSTSPANARTVSKSSSLLAAIVLSTLTLAACGGGGGGGSSPPPASPSNPPPPPPPPPPANTAPTASAGADQTIQLPTNSVTLAGSATDPDTANTITYAWTSTPADGVTFANAAAAATTATFAAAGTYTLTLTANDGTATGTDALVVTVNAAAPPPGPTLSWPGPDDNVDPNHGWVAAANPAEVGMDSARLIEAETVALKGGGSGFVARYGKIAHKWGNIDARVDVKSATKSIGGIALALAIDDGKVKLGDKAQLHLPGIGVDPDLAGTPNDATALSSITLLNLATHTAGFEKIR